MKISRLDLQLIDMKVSARLLSASAYPADRAHASGELVAAAGRQIRHQNADHAFDANRSVLAGDQVFAVVFRIRNRESVGGKNNCILRWDDLIAYRWKCAAWSRPAVRPRRPLREETSRLISSDRPVIDADIPATAGDQLGALDGCEDRHRVLLQVLIARRRPCP